MDHNYHDDDTPLAVPAIIGGVVGGLGTVLQIKGIDPDAVMTTTQLLEVMGNSLWGSLQFVGMVGLAKHMKQDVDKVFQFADQVGKALVDALPKIIGDTAGKVSEKIDLIAQAIGQKAAKIVDQFKGQHHDQEDTLSR